MELDCLKTLKTETQNGVMQIMDISGRVCNETFKYNEPALEADFRLLAASIPYFPSQLRDLYLFGNGFEIYNYDGIDGFRIFPISELISFNHSISDSYAEDWSNDIIIFMECIGDGTYIGMRCDNDTKGAIVDCPLDAFPDEWAIIASDLDSFFEALIHSKGLKFWL